MAGQVSFFFVVVATTIIAASSRAVNISNTWMLPEEGFPVFYRYFRDRISWNEADAVCQFHHANLVTVDTTSQYDAIRAYLKELDIANNVWIGLSRGSDTKNFTWRDFRALSLTDYWQEAIPTGNDPQCAAMDPAADFRWHALSCGGPEVAAFICELPVPSWATGPKGCLLTELPSLTVLYIPEQSAVELTSDCGLGGTKRIACKGNTDREDIMRRLACTDSSDILEDKMQSPVPTTVNQDSTFASTNTAHVTNTMKTTKPWIWTSNTIDTGDYGLPTRHRRETEDTLGPASTMSTNNFSTKQTFTPKSPTESNAKIELLTTIIETTSPSDLSTMESEIETTTETKAESVDEYPSAINQGQLFSIIENGTMFDIIELNGTEDNKTQTDSKSTETSLYTTDIYHKEPTEDAVTTNYKIIPTVVEAKNLHKISLNDLPQHNLDKTLSKEVEMFPITGNSMIKLNRTNRKELPISTRNNIDGIEKESVHKTVEIRIHEPGNKNSTKSTLFVTTRRNTDKNIDKTSGVKKVSEESLSKEIGNEAKTANKGEYKSTLSGEYATKAREFTTDSDAEFTTVEAVETKAPVEEPFDAEPTTKPNRQRQLTRPQRRSFYPYFFSRVLG